MNPGGGACSELRSGHCTPAWATERDSVSKKKNKKKTGLSIDGGLSEDPVKSDFVLVLQIDLWFLHSDRKVLFVVSIYPRREQTHWLLLAVQKGLTEGVLVWLGKHSC